MQARYIGKLIYDVTLRAPGQDGYVSTAPNSINKNTFPSALNFNLNAQYNLIDREGGKLQLFGVVTNLLDRNPPRAVSVVNFTAGNWNPYDVIGRAFRMGIRFEY